MIHSENSKTTCAQKNNQRITIVGVMGSSQEEYESITWPLGRWLAEQGYHLLTGGGRGVMASISRAFASIPKRKGTIIGIIPAQRFYGERERASYQTKSGYPNDWVEIPIITHLPLTGLEGKENLSRNHLNILTSDVVIALPGQEGTRTEMELAFEYQKPLIIFHSFQQSSPALPQGAACYCSTLAEVIKAMQSYPAITSRRHRSTDEIFKA